MPSTKNVGPMEFEHAQIHDLPWKMFRSLVAISRVWTSVLINVVAEELRLNLALCPLGSLALTNIPVSPLQSTAPLFVTAWTGRHDVGRVAVKSVVLTLSLFH